MATRNDYRILQAILDENDDTKGISKLNGTTRLEIQAKTKDESSEKTLSLSKIAQALKYFMDEGLVEEGINEGKTKSYILTPEGVDILNELQEEV